MIFLFVRNDVFIVSTGNYLILIISIYYSSFFARFFLYSWIRDCINFTKTS